MPINQKLTRDADATVVDDDNGTWFAVWNSTEGFDPFTAAIRAESPSDAEDVWFENFPDRGTGESLVVMPCTITVNFVLAWPDGEVTPEMADKPTS